MEANNFMNIQLKDFKWLNEPKKWNANLNVLSFVTDNKTDFWQGTWYNFYPNSGHLFGVEIKDDFTFSVRTASVFILCVIFYNLLDKLNTWK